MSTNNARLMGDVIAALDMLPDKAIPEIMAKVVEEWNNRMYGMDDLLKNALGQMVDSDAKDEFRAALEDWK